MKDNYTLEPDKITITELWGLGHITFNPPLVIEVYLPEAPEKDYAHIVYDFGMSDRVPITKEKNWLINYAKNNEECDPLKTVFSTIKFDLMHAFFHFNEDPNYGHTHWALYGNLENRVDCNDVEEYGGKPNRPIET